jgi:hypothetical protein
VQPLLDNDVIVKTASFSLVAELDRLLRSNGAKRPYFCVPAAFGSLRLSDKLPLYAKFYATTNVRKDAYTMYAMCEPLPWDAVDAMRLKRLTAVPGIDDGEARFIDYACSNADTLLFTGDGRCVRTLAATASLTDICAQLQGRFVHFDTLLEGLAAMSHFSIVRERVLAAPAVDFGLARALDAVHSETTARENLGRRIAVLEADSFGLLRTKF